MVIMQVQADKWNHAGILLEENMLCIICMAISASACRMVDTGWKGR
jgi:hypothetical protein